MEKENQTEEVFKADPKRSLQELGAVVGIRGSTVWHFLRNKYKLLLYRLLVGQQLLETGKVNRVPFDQPHN